MCLPYATSDGIEGRVILRELTVSVRCEGSPLCLPGSVRRNEWQNHNGYVSLGTEIDVSVIGALLRASTAPHSLAILSSGPQSALFHASYVYRCTLSEALCVHVEVSNSLAASAPAVGDLGCRHGTFSGDRLQKRFIDNSNALTGALSSSLPYRGAARHCAVRVRAHLRLRRRHLYVASTFADSVLKRPCSPPVAVTASCSLSRAAVCLSWPRR